MEKADFSSILSLTVDLPFILLIVLLVARNSLTGIRILCVGSLDSLSMTGLFSIIDRDLLLSVTQLSSSMTMNCI